MSKYAPLRNYLAIHRGPSLHMDFGEVEELVDGLPPSAFRYREWWANDQTHVQAQAWIGAGWMVESADLDTRVVHFTTSAAEIKPSRPTARGGKGDLYEPFWTEYLEARKRLHPDWPGHRSPTRQGWLGSSSGIGGTQLTSSFARGNRLRSELMIGSNDLARNEEIFAALLSQRKAIEEGFGRSLVFEELPGYRMSRIADYRPDSDIRDLESHAAFIAWFLDAEARFRRAIDPLTRR